MNGFISQKSYPFSHEKNIAREFCESQVEIISPICSSIDELYKKIYQIDKKVRDYLVNLGDKEYVWPFSNPPYIADEREIKVSKCYEYDEEENQRKNMYKEYLADKYDKRKLLYCGIHFNYSYSEDFVKLLFKRSNATNYMEFKNNMYLSLAKKVAENSWLLVYLTAASPVFDISLKEYNNYGKDCFEGEGSSRNGENGFWNKSVLTVDYSSMDAYIGSLKKYIKENIIYAESEWYTPVRIKSVGENSLDRLKQYGADHIELRMFDLNPMTKLGVYKEDLDFIHWFIVYLTLKSEIDFKETDQINAVENHKKSACFDCSDVYINVNGEKVLLLEKALSILEDMECLFKQLNRDDISIQVSRIKQRVLKPGSRYVNKIYNKFKDDYVKKGVMVAKYYSM